jgi:hypothetical protein
MPVFPVGDWTPDQPPTGQIGEAGTVKYSMLVKNVVPLTEQSYGPLPGPVPFTAPLGARVQGLYTVRGDDGQGNIFAGDASKLYRLIGNASSFSDVSGATYACPAPGAGFWSMTSFGSRVVATDLADPVQSMLLGVDTHFASLAASAPKARFAAVIRDFLFLGNLDDPVDGRLPSRLQWSAIGDPTNWPTPGTDVAVQLQSDYQDLEQQDLGPITGLVGPVSNAHGIAFCERGIYRITYQGSPLIFSFDVVEGASGTMAPQSIVPRHIRTQAGIFAVAYYLGSDGFYAHDGASAMPIGSGKVDRWFFDTVDPHYRYSIVGSTDPTRQLIVWGFASKQSANGMLDRLLIYNWALARWSYGELDATPLETIGRSLFSTYSLDQLDAVGNLDTLTPSLDAGYWVGGRSILAGTDAQHRLNYMAGPNLAPLCETAELQPVAGRRALVRMARALTDGQKATIETGHRELQSLPVIYEPKVRENENGTCPQWASGRYIRFRLGLPAGTDFEHIQGVDTSDGDIIPAGRR